MLGQVGSTLAMLCNAGGLLLTVAGALMVAWGLIGGGGPGSYIKGGALVLLGMWVSRLAG